MVLVLQVYSVVLCLQAAEDLNAALFVHPWDMQLDGRMKKYWLPWLVGMPSETATAICSLLMGGVLEKFPRLKICFAHGGGAFPYLIGRIEHGYNVRPDLCATENPFSPRCDQPNDIITCHITIHKLLQKVCQTAVYRFFGS